MPFADERYEHEVFEYLKDLISCITTGDEEQDFDMIKRYAQLIATQQGSDAEEVAKYLKQIRDEYFAQIKNGSTP